MTITPVTEDLPDITREEACRLVVSGMESIRRGILAYHHLGLTVSDLYTDLKDAGWSKSKRTIERYATELRKEGKLPQSPLARINPGKSAAKNGGGSVENSKPKDDEVNDVQQQAADESIKSRNEYISQLHAVIDDLAAKLESAKNSTLPNHDQPKSIRRPEQLADPSGLAVVEVSEECGMDPHTPPPIDYEWHPGVQMDSQERRDIIRIGRLVDEIGAIQKRYAFTGKLGPREWEQIYGGLQAVSAVANAQRRYRPGSVASRVIDIG